MLSRSEEIYILCYTIRCAVLLQVFAEFNTLYTYNVYMVPWILSGEGGEGRGERGGGGGGGMGELPPTHVACCDDLEKIKIKIKK